MFTYGMLAEKLINLTDIDWQGKEEQRNTCRYGLEMLIALIANCMLMILIGVVSGRQKEMFIYLFAWGSLRLFAGGRHAKNHMQCITSFTAVMLLVIYAGRYLAVYEEVKIIILAFMLAGLVINAVYAGRHKEDKEKAAKSKKETLIVLGIEVLLVCYFMNDRYIGTQIPYYLTIFSGAVMAESFFLLPIEKFSEMFGKESEK